MIIFSEEFHQSIEKLVEILFFKKYFGFKTDCQLYADKIYDFIESNISLPISKLSPATFKKFGREYIKYKANTQTTWYIFFDQKEGRYLVNHILNNHSKDFPELL